MLSQQFSFGHIWPIIAQNAYKIISIIWGAYYLHKKGYTSQNWHFFTNQLLLPHASIYYQSCRKTGVSRKTTCSTTHAVLLNGKSLSTNIWVSTSHQTCLGHSISKQYAIMLESWSKCFTEGSFQLWMPMPINNFTPDLMHLEYASQVWDPHLIKDIHALESLQKFALRVCNGLPLSNILELLQPPRICCKKTSDETVYYVQANSWPYWLSSIYPLHLERMSMN